MAILLGAAGCSGRVERAELGGSSSGGGGASVGTSHAAAPTALVSGGAPHGLVVGDDRVCWTDPAGGSVRCVAKSGGAPWTVAEGQGGPCGIALALGNAPASWGPMAHDAVYWTNEISGTVMGATPDGSLFTIAANLDHPRAVVAFAGDIYALSELYVSTSGPLVHLGVPGGGTMVVADDVGQADASGLAVDFGGDRAYAAPSLAIVPLDGAPGPVLTYAAAVRGVAFDATSVYFTNGDALVAAPLEGGPLSTLANGTGTGTGEGVAVDATYAYWVTAGTPENGYDDGAVWRVPVAGGPRVIVAAGQAHPLAIALDDDSIYWTVAGSPTSAGAVMKLEKRLVAPWGGSP